MRAPDLTKIELNIIDDLVKSLKSRFSVIPANPGSGPGQAPESRVSCENRNPDSYISGPRLSPG